VLFAAIPRNGGGRVTLYIVFGEKLVVKSSRVLYMGLDEHVQ